MPVSLVLVPIRAMTRSKPLRWAIFAGVAASVGLALIPNPFGPLMSGLVAWDVTILAYLAGLYLRLRHATPEHLAMHADETDEGRHFVLFVSVLAVAASIAVIVFALLAPDPSRQHWRLPLVFTTIALSWLFVHASFASHYAHEYYGSRADTRIMRGGLLFPGGEAPDFWDFWHFSFVIGVACQTADIQITTRAFRRVVTWHGICAFLFNTTILAFSMNVTASLFSR